MVTNFSVVPVTRIATTRMINDHVSFYNGVTACGNCCNNFRDTSNSILIYSSQWCIIFTHADSVRSSTIPTWLVARIRFTRRPLVCGHISCVHRRRSQASSRINSMHRLGTECRIGAYNERTLSNDPNTNNNLRRQRPNHNPPTHLQPLLLHPPVRRRPRRLARARLDAVAEITLLYQSVAFSIQVGA